jgi:hexosaminidase
LGVALLAGTLMARAAPLAVPIELDWQSLGDVDRHDARGQVIDDSRHTLARIRLVNSGTTALAGAGWSIQFSCETGVEEGPIGDSLLVERVVGTQFRLRPRAGFAGLAPGAQLLATMEHGGAVGSPAKAIDGAYYSEDATPGDGHPLAQLRLLPMPMLPDSVTPAQLFDRYARLAPTGPVALPPVFPAPLAWQAGEGALHWSTLPVIQAPTVLAVEARRARELLVRYLPATPARGAALAAGSGKSPGLRLQLASDLGPWARGLGPEAYELRVDAHQGITLRARTAAGMANAIASLHELLPLEPAADAGLTLPAVAIQDAPRFPYRGFMLDVVRNFEPVPQVLRLLDLMARYKLNTLHLHLTDDEGWRIEVPGLPELTRYGARRGPAGADADHLPPAHGSGADIGNPYGSGYYTREDYLAILRHARALHIDVLPEVEMPGHARAAVHAMAWRARARAAAGLADDGQRLDDPADASHYSSAQLYGDNVLNPAMPGTYLLIEKVVGQLVALHAAAGMPLRVLHVGGDELPAHAWGDSPAIRELMAREGLATRADVWQRFYERVGAILAHAGVRAAGWEEIAMRESADGGPATPATALRLLAPRAQVWNMPAADVAEPASANVAVQLANAGFDVVLSPASRFYFDMMQLRSPAEPGHDWAGHVDLDATFDFVPFEPAGQRAAVQLTAEGRGHVLGLEGTLFTELVHDPARLDYMLMPRLLALAERAWSPDPAWTHEADPARAEALHRADWARFAAQLGERVLPRLDAEHAGVGYRIPPPGLRASVAGIEANSLLPGFTLRYSVGAKAPAADSPAVDGPISVHGLVQVADFARDGRAGPPSIIDTTIH